MKWILLATAGALGTLARYGLATTVQRWSGHAFPWGTFAVNIIGCFLFGFIWALLEQRQASLGLWRTVVLVGFLGSFTTFSSFAHDSGAFLREAEWFAAAANIIAQNVIGLLALFTGLAVARWF